MAAGVSYLSREAGNLFDKKASTHDVAEMICAWRWRSFADVKLKVHIYLLGVYLSRFLLSCNIDLTRSWTFGKPRDRKFEASLKFEQSVFDTKSHGLRLQNYLWLQTKVMKSADSQVCDYFLFIAHKRWLHIEKKSLSCWQTMFHSYFINWKTCTQFLEKCFKNKQG